MHREKLFIIEFQYSAANQKRVMTINYAQLSVPKAVGLEVDDIIARLTEEYR